MCIFHFFPHRYGVLRLKCYVDTTSNSSFHAMNRRTRELCGSYLGVSVCVCVSVLVSSYKHLSFTMPLDSMLASINIGILWLFDIRYSQHSRKIMCAELMLVGIGGCIGCATSASEILAYINIPGTRTAVEWNVL